MIEDKEKQYSGLEGELLAGDAVREGLRKEKQRVSYHSVNKPILLAVMAIQRADHRRLIVTSLNRICITVVHIIKVYSLRANQRTVLLLNSY